MCSLWVLFVLASCTSQTKKFEVAFEEGNLKEAETILKEIKADVGKYSEGWLAVKSRGKWGFVD